MSEQEFDLYLKLLARCLAFTPAQREQISDELRDHLEERLAELARAGVPREKAVVQALDEFGDAAVLAAHFTSIAHLKRRRFLMRLSLGSVSVLAAGMLVAWAFWPENRGIQGPGQVVAQERKKEKSAASNRKAPEGVIVPKKGVPSAPVQRVSGPPLSSDLASKSTARIEEALDQAVDFTLDPQPLQEALDYIAKRYNTPVILDNKALEEAGIDPKMEVKIDVPGIRFRQMLNLLLAQAPSPMGFAVMDEVLQISTIDKLREVRTIVVYDCRDLINVQSMRVPEAARRRIEAAVHAEEPQPSGSSSTSGTSSSGSTSPPAQPGKHRGGKGAKQPLFSRSNALARIDLIQVLMAATDPDGWDAADSDGKTISEFGGLLVVRQSPIVHEEIKRVLSDIRLIRKEGAFSNLEKNHGGSTSTTSPATFEKSAEDFSKPGSPNGL